MKVSKLFNRVLGIQYLDLRRACTLFLLLCRLFREGTMSTRLTHDFTAGCVKAKSVKKSRAQGNPSAGKRRKQTSGTQDPLADAASSAILLDVRAAPGSRHVDTSKRRTQEPDPVPDTSDRNEDCEEEDEHGEGGEDSADGGGDEEEGEDAGNDDDDDQSESSVDSEDADGSGSDSEGQSEAELAGARRLQAAAQPKKTNAVSQKWVVTRLTSFLAVRL